jgi:hypothetical protein
VYCFCKKLSTINAYIIVTMNVVFVISACLTMLLLFQPDNSLLIACQRTYKTDTRTTLWYHHCWCNWARIELGIISKDLYDKVNVLHIILNNLTLDCILAIQNGQAPTILDSTPLVICSFKPWNLCWKFKPCGTNSVECAYHHLDVCKDCFEFNVAKEEMGGGRFKVTTKWDKEQMQL